MPFKKVLIAVDSSEYSMAATKKGLELAHQLKAEAALIYVVDTSKAMGSVDANIMPSEALLVLKKEAEETLEQLSKMYNGTGLMKFMPEGHPSEDVIKTSTTWNADLIVVGTHGRTGLERLLTGSVAEHILRHSQIPVMVVTSK